MDQELRKDEADESTQRPDVPATPEPSRRWDLQILGGVVGAVAAYAISGIAGELGWAVGERSRWLLWGAVLGSLLGSGEVLSRAGARLTGKSNRVLNTAVAVLGMVLVFAILTGLVVAAVGLYRSFVH